MFLQSCYAHNVLFDLEPWANKWIKNGLSLVDLGLQVEQIGRSAWATNGFSLSLLNALGLQLDPIDGYLVDLVGKLLDPNGSSWLHWGSKWI